MEGNNLYEHLSNRFSMQEAQIIILYIFFLFSLSIVKLHDAFRFLYKMHVSATPKDISRLFGTESRNKSEVFDTKRSPD